MKKPHVFAVALLIGLAALLGVVAASRTVGVGASSRSHVGTAAIASRTQQLHRIELALQRALRDRPPALPRVPAAPRASATPSAPQLIYQRPAPIVVIKHASHHDDAGEAQGGGDD